MANPIQDPVLGTLEFDDEGVAEVFIGSDGGDFPVHVACDGKPDAAEIAQCTGPLKDLDVMFTECINALADAMEVVGEYCSNNGVTCPEAGDDAAAELSNLLLMKDAGIYPDQKEDVLKVDFVALDESDSEIESDDVLCVSFDRDGDVTEVSMERD